MLTDPTDLLSMLNMHALQMVDIKNRRHFLKKVSFPCFHVLYPIEKRPKLTRYASCHLPQMRPPPDFREELLYLGNTVTLLSRQLKIIDYGDEFTRSKMQTRHERSV
jgi:nucleoside-diphosphate kinase